MDNPQNTPSDNGSGSEINLPVWAKITIVALIVVASAASAVAAWVVYTPGPQEEVAAQVTATQRPPTATSRPRATETVAPAATAVSENQDLVDKIVGQVMAQAPGGDPQAVEAVVADVVTTFQAEGQEVVPEAVANAVFNILLESGRFCWADKHATWAEVDGAGPQRMEISTGIGIGHLDIYPSPDEPTVSVIVHPGEEAVLKGLGSLFVFPRERCTGFDPIEDAKLYAEGRYDFGHSGLVYASLYDFLNGKAPIVNLHGINPSELTGPVLWDEAAAQAAVREITGFTPDPRVLACGEAAPTHQVPVDGTPWQVGDADHVYVVNFWTNWKQFAQEGDAIFRGEHTVMVLPGQVVSFNGGGSSFAWTADCLDVAEEAYKANPLPHLAVDDLVKAGLATVVANPTSPAATPAPTATATP